MKHLWRHFWKCLGLLLLVFVGFVVLTNTIDSASKTIDIYAARFEDRDAEKGPTEDYVAFYAAGRLVREGRGDELYDVDAIVAEEHEIMGRPVGGTGRLAFFNPPFVAALWAPLSGLALDDALIVWAVLVALVLALSAIAGPRLLGLKGHRWLLASLALLVAETTITVLMQAQLTAFVVASWILFAASMKAGNQKAAGVSLALALVKPHYVLLPLAFLFVKRQWRAVAVFSAAALPLVAVSLLAAGVPALWEYPLYLYESTSWRGVNGVMPWGMAGWYGTLNRHDLDSLTPFISGVTVLLTLIGLTRSSTTDLRVYGVLLVASLLISSHLNGQDMTLLIVACWFFLAPWSIVLSLFALTAGSDFQTMVLATLLFAWLIGVNRSLVTDLATWLKSRAVPARSTIEVTPTS